MVATERAPGDARTLWAGTRVGRVFISKNADDAQPRNVRFTRLDTPSTPGRFVSGIAVDPADPNHAWISYSGYEAYTPGEPGHVFEARYSPATGRTSRRTATPCTSTRRGTGRVATGSRSGPT